MHSYQGKKMIKLILATALTVCAIQAEDVVHYDTKKPTKQTITKPYHPSTDLYSKK